MAFVFTISHWIVYCMYSPIQGLTVLRMCSNHTYYFCCFILSARNILSGVSAFHAIPFETLPLAIGAQPQPNTKRAQAQDIQDPHA
jgi:hypothetical protein